MRLPPTPQIVLRFVVDSGFSPIGNCPPTIRFGEQRIELTGFPSESYRAELILTESGTFGFFIEGFDSRGTIQMPPRIYLKDEPLVPDQFILQTVVSKWMGPFEDWDGHLKGAAHAGFNWIHFTPLQRRGLSNSPYSLYDHQQLSPDLFTGTTDNGLSVLSRKIEWMEKGLGLLSMIDVVWNHIACNSPHLLNHPEIGYNLENSPHLCLAYELDECILRFSRDLEAYGLAREVKDEDDVQKLLLIFQHQVIPEAALWEYFVVDTSQAVRDLETAFRKEAFSPPPSPTGPLSPFTSPTACSDLSEAIYNDQSFSRSAHRMNLAKVKGYYSRQLEEYRQIAHEGDRSVFLSRILAEYRSTIDRINYPRYAVYDEKIQRIIINLANRLRYERLDPKGPKLGLITEHCPLASTYFTRFESVTGGKIVACANNGWIWNADPLVNFAEASCDAYFTRDVIVWGDCVKLRYGYSPEDSPWLWNYMAQYTESMAQIFHGFRIDNCHSTPIHVAEYLIRRARQARPELYVCAELFTPSEERDLMFVKRLGLNSLIREAMVAWDVAELGRLVRKYGGQPVGHPFIRPEYSNLFTKEGKTCFASSTPHTMFMDCSHDNEMPTQKRTAIDSLPNAAIVAFCSAAHGSVRGYDDLFPYHLNIVHESRRYPDPQMKNNLWPIRKELAALHQRIVKKGFTMIDIKKDGDILIISRYNPQNWSGILLIAKTAFSDQHSERHLCTYLHFRILTFFIDSELDLFGFKITKYVLEANISSTGQWEEQKQTIPTLFATIDVHKFEEEPYSNGCPTLAQLAPGSIMIAELQPAHELRPFSWSRVYSIIEELDFYDLNILLYRCAAEENDEEPHRGTYCVPSHGCLAYSGLAGFMILIERIANYLWNEDHPLWVNIRDGDWALEYLINRLERPQYPNLKLLKEAIQEDVLSAYQLRPSSTKPNAFVKIVKSLYYAALNRCYGLLSSIPKSFPELSMTLAFTSIQLTGLVFSTGLHPTVLAPSLSAGLPHFSTRHMRCWGRDTFIALPGLFLLTGRFEDARKHLLAFAACYYRGLIPNLLDSARRPRYNSRDATWWFLHALRAYCSQVPNGQSILDESVALRFPHDNYTDYDDPTNFSHSYLLREIVQRIMQAHAQGIEFREWNAGPNLDPVMKEAGFTVKIKLDQQTGFIHGGSIFNCGTWMDKMGESEKAGNRGTPATPRDGAAIELVALLAEALDWLIKDNPTGYDGVQLANNTFFRYKEWRHLLQENFERHFYIPIDAKNESEGLSVTRHCGIYKDTVGSSELRQDLQLRPNMVIAMATSPSLFTCKNAHNALAMAEKFLVAPIGMRTLSFDDPDYRPHYDNNNDSEDWHVAKGFNYHQGPEWVWPLGHYLRACLYFQYPTNDTRGHVMKKLGLLMAHLKASNFAGLAELTNKDGEFCPDSCATQAWSSASILEVLQALDQLS